MNGMKMENVFRVSEQEIKLLKLIREVEFGEIHIIVKEGKPTRIEKISKSIKLD